MPTIGPLIHRGVISHWLNTAPTGGKLVTIDVNGQVREATASEIGIAAGLAPIATSGSATDLTTGTIADARLSSNVPLKNAASNVFTGAASFGGDITASQKVILGTNSFLQSDGTGAMKYETSFAGTANFKSLQSGQSFRFNLVTAEPKSAGLWHYDVSNAKGRLLEVFSEPGVAIAIVPGNTELLRLTSFGGNVITSTGTWTHNGGLLIQNANSASSVSIPAPVNAGFSRVIRIDQPNCRIALENSNSDPGLVISRTDFANPRSVINSAGTGPQNQLALQVNSTTQLLLSETSARFSGTVQVGGSGGPLLKNSSGTLQVRNSADSAFSDVRALRYFVGTNNLEISQNNFSVTLPRAEVGDYLGVGVAILNDRRINLIPAGVNGFGVSVRANVGQVAAPYVYVSDGGSVLSSLNADGGATFTGPVSLSNSLTVPLNVWHFNNRTFFGTNNTIWASGQTGTALSHSWRNFTGSDLMQLYGNGDIVVNGTAQVGGGSGPVLKNFVGTLQARLFGDTGFTDFAARALTTTTPDFGSAATPANCRLRLGYASGSYLAGVITGRGYSTNFAYADVIISANPNGGVVDYSNLTDDLVVRGQTGNVEINRGTLVVNSSLVQIGSTRPINLNGTNGFISIRGQSGGWATDVRFLGSTGTQLTAFGAAGTDNTLSYAYIGNFGSEVARFAAGGLVSINTATRASTSLAILPQFTSERKAITILDYGDFASGNGHGLFDVSYLGGSVAVPAAPVPGHYRNILTFRTGGTGATFFSNPSFTIRCTIGSTISGVLAEVNTSLMGNTTATGVPFPFITMFGQTGLVNVDPGTLQLGSGVRLKNNSGQLQVRNSGDTANAVAILGALGVTDGTGGMEIIPSGAFNVVSIGSTGTATRMKVGVGGSTTALGLFSDYRANAYFIRNTSDSIIWSSDASGNIVNYGTLQIGVTTGPVLRANSNGLDIRNSGNTDWGQLNVKEIRGDGLSYSRFAQLSTAGSWGGGYNFNLTGGTANRDSTGTVAGVWYSTTGINWYAEPSAVAGAITARMILSPTKLTVNTDGQFGTQTTNGIVTILGGQTTNVACLSLLKWGNREGYIGQSTNLLCIGVSGGLGTYSDSTLQSNAAIHVADSKAVAMFGTLSVTGAATFSSHITSAFQSLSADPSTLDISAGLSRLVKNTTSGEIRWFVNDGGTIKKSAAFT